MVNKLIFDILNLPQKCAQNAFYGSIICICRKIVVLLQRKSLNDKNMEAAVRERGSMPMTYVPTMGDYESDVYYTREEFMDELAKQLGQAYGLNDIREAC